MRLLLLDLKSEGDALDIIYESIREAAGWASAARRTFPSHAMLEGLRRVADGSGGGPLAENRFRLFGFVLIIR